MFGKMIMTRALPLALLGAVASAQPALAVQAQGAIVAGAKVNDPKGGEVGTVVKVDGQFVILKTDKHEARLPVASFTPHQGAFLVAMTRDELNAAIDKTLGEANQKIAVGAAVSGSQGGNVGVIDAMEGDLVTLKLASGVKVRLPRASLAPGPNGAVIGMTAAELEAAAAAAGGAAAQTKPEATKAEEPKPAAKADKPK